MAGLALSEGCERGGRDKSANKTVNLTNMRYGWARQQDGFLLIRTVAARGSLVRFRH